MWRNRERGGSVFFSKVVRSNIFGAWSGRPHPIQSAGREVWYFEEEKH